MNKISPAMLNALHYFVGNMTTCSNDPTHVAPKQVTIDALWKRGLLSLNDDSIIIPNEAGMSVLRHLGYRFDSVDEVTSTPASGESALNEDDNSDMFIDKTTWINDHLSIDVIDNRAGHWQAAPAVKQLIMIGVDNYLIPNGVDWQVDEWDMQKATIYAPASRPNWQTAYRIARVLKQHGIAQIHTSRHVMITASMPIALLITEQSVTVSSADVVVTNNHYLKAQATKDLAKLNNAKKAALALEMPTNVSAKTHASKSPRIHEIAQYKRLKLVEIRRNREIAVRLDVARQIQRNSNAPAETPQMPIDSVMVPLAMLCDVCAHSALILESEESHLHAHKPTHPSHENPCPPIIT